jgi:hypothetical protein
LRGAWGAILRGGRPTAGDRDRVKNDWLIMKAPKTNEEIVMAYRYEMVQLPPNIQISASGQKGNEAAVYLQNVVNEKAKTGWEFYRVDTIGVATKPGCLDGLLGKKEELTNFYVVTFRQPQ